MPNPEIHVDVHSSIVERDIDRNAAELRARYERLGADSADAMAKGFASSTKFERASERLIGIQEKVAVQERKLNELRAQSVRQLDELTSKEDNVASIRSALAAATARASEAEDRHNNARSAGIGHAARAERAERDLVSARSEVARLTAELSGAETDLDRSRSTHVGTLSRIADVESRLTQTHRTHVRSVDEVRKSYQDFSRESEKFAGTSRTVERLFSNMGRSAARNLGALTPLGTVGPTVVAPLIATLVETANMAVAASQGLWLLPAAAGGAAAAMGTLTMGMSGFSQVMKDLVAGDLEKFATDIQRLSPAAQQAALSIQAMFPLLEQLRLATQESLFAGVAEQLEQVITTYEPLIEKLTTGIADAMNKAFSGVAGQLMTPEVQTDISTIIDNLVKAFHELTPAITSFVQAFTDIAVVGSDFLPDLATSIADVARDFAGFIREARESGQLKQWIEEGIYAVKALAAVIFEAGQMLYTVFGIKSKEDADKFKSTMEDLIVVLGIVLQEVKMFADMFGFAVRHIVDAIADIPEALTWVGNKAIDIFSGISEIILNALISPIKTAIEWYNKIPKLPDIEMPDINVQIPHLPPSWGGDWGPAQWPWQRGGMGDQGPTASQAWDTETPFGQQGGWKRRPVPPKPAETGPGGAKGPQVPYPAEYGQMLPGEKPEDFKKRMSWLDAQHDLAQKRLELDEMEKGGIASQDDIIKKRNEVLRAKVAADEAEMAYEKSQIQKNVIPFPAGYGEPPAPGQTQEQYSAQQDLYRAQQKTAQALADYTALQNSHTASTDELNEAYGKLQNARSDEYQTLLRLQKALNSASNAAENLGVEIDKDFGISKGLPGIVENITRMLANFALAPTLGSLAQQARSAPPGASGLIGLGAVQGLFGPQYVPGADQGIPPGYQPGVYPGSQGTPGQTPGAQGNKATAGALTQEKIDEIAQAFGLTRGSTFRNEPGSLHNTGQATDYSGPPGNMVAFAQYMASAYGPQLSELIHDAPGFTRNIKNGEIKGPFGGFYNEAQAGEHKSHVHVGTQTPRGAQQQPTQPGQSSSLMAPRTGPRPAGGWQGLAQRESGGNWQITYGEGAADNPVSGGLQIGDATWRDYGGVAKYGVPRAYMASPEAQMDIAERILAGQGPGAWPNTFYGQRGGEVPGALIPRPLPAPGGGGGGALSLDEYLESLSKPQHQYIPATASEMHTAAYNAQYQTKTGVFDPNLIGNPATQPWRNRLGDQYDPQRWKYMQDYWENQYLVNPDPASRIVPHQPTPDEFKMYRMQTPIPWLTPFPAGTSGQWFPIGPPAHGPDWNPDESAGNVALDPRIRIDTSTTSWGPSHHWDWGVYNPGGFARGGGTDTVPAMLTPGEHVLTREDVAAAGGQGAIYAWRRALHMQGGNEVPHLPPELVNAPPPAPGPAGPTPVENLAAVAAGAPVGTLPGVQGATRVGGTEPPSLPGGSAASGGGALGSAAAAAADVFAPGAGVAASITMQEIGRAIKYGAQVAGIGVQGLMETFLPTGVSELAQNSWLTRIASGFASATPQLPNIAGQASTPSLGQMLEPAPQFPNAPAPGSGTAGGPTIGVNIENYNVTDTENAAGQHLADYFTARKPQPGQW